MLDTTNCANTSLDKDNDKPVAVVVGQTKTKQDTTVKVVVPSHQTR